MIEIYRGKPSEKLRKWCEDHYNNPYVQDGLVAMWDGEWNNGLHDHNPHKFGFSNLGSLGDGFDLIWNSDSQFGKNYAYFNGITAARTINEGFLNNILHDKCTIEVVFQPDQDWGGNYRGLLGNHGGTEQQPWARYNRINCLQYEDGKRTIALWDVGGGDDFVILPDNMINWKTTELNYLQFGFSADDLKSFCNYNGQLVYENTVWNANILTMTHPGPFYVGAAWYDTNRVFKGKIYSVRCYDRKLSQAELLANYNADIKRFG